MLAALAGLLVLAAPAEREGGDVAVLVVRRTSVDAQQAHALAESVATLLSKAGVAVEAPAETVRRLGALGVKETTQCGGRKACVLELLRQLGRPAGVAVSVSQLGGERSVALEAIRAKDGAVLAKEAAVLKKDEALDERAVASLASALIKQWPAAAPVVEAPAPEPKPVALTPAPKPAEPAPAPAPEVFAPAPEPIAPKSHVPGIVLTVAAVAAAGVAAGFLGGAFTARGQLLQSNAGRSPYTGSEAQQLADAANMRGGIAGGVAVLALALGITAVVIW
jgi:hypothetical protein